MWIPGDTVTIPFVTSLATGAAHDADVLPTAKLMHNGAYDTTVTVDVAEIEAGVYTATFAMPEGYVRGDSIAIIAFSQIDNILTKWTAWTGAVGQLPLSAAAVWNFLADEATVAGSVGLEFRKIYASLHGNYTVSYPSATSVTATFYDTDGSTVMVSVSTSLDSSGRPIERAVT